MPLARARIRHAASAFGGAPVTVCGASLTLDGATLQLRAVTG
jgi:hypothetical protein